MAKHKKFIELDQTKSLKNIKRHYKNNTKKRSFIVDDASSAIVQTFAC